jgi:hypothetical protein
MSTNLNVLSIAINKISDVSPLAGLAKLGELRLEYNEISDISPLTGLTNLERLELQYNKISDFSPLTDNRVSQKSRKVHLARQPGFPKRRSENRGTMVMGRIAEYKTR